ncbi:hypothetical protein Y032_0002g502 [Ancylostoma ceylanicum]|uniref:Uncharacterized protein n=1 Tax=Ancylostoma ceylanicum TaxID=53326 RepID=A0A016VZR8_9BILA|nr:hypothetical protein Y032_0002g502 [Ancylostoma ceylanicum]
MTWRTLDRRNYYGHALARPRISAAADVAGGMALATVNTHAMCACRDVVRTLPAYSGRSLRLRYLGKPRTQLGRALLPLQESSDQRNPIQRFCGFSRENCHNNQLFSKICFEANCSIAKPSRKSGS